METNYLKCPACEVPLQEIGGLLQCPNDRCAWIGNAELWKALEISHKVIAEISDECGHLIAALIDCGQKKLAETFKKNLQKQVKKITKGN